MSTGWPTPFDRLGVVRDPTRQLMSVERDAAEYLAARGYDVAAVPFDDGPTPDFIVTGSDGALRVELKTPQPGADDSTIRNRMRDGRRQCRNLLFDLRRSRMVREVAERGVRRGLGAYSRYFDSVRVVGDGYDFTRKVGD